MKTTPLRTVGRRGRGSDHAPQTDQRPRRTVSEASRRPTPRRPARLVVELVVAIALTGVLAFFEVAFVLTSTGVLALQSSSRGGQIGGAIVFLILLALSTRWTISIEHRLRSGQPVARSFAVRHTHADVDVDPSAMSPRLRRRYGPLSRAVTLGSPVLGVSTTTVHYHARSYLASGERVSVLVDPRHPAYAELPGYPFTKSSDWIPAGLFALIMAALAAYDAVLLARQLSHRRRHAAGRVSMADA
jgi:hypothetical protein